MAIVRTAISIHSILASKRGNSILKRKKKKRTKLVNRVINMVSPFLGIPVFPFFWSTFFGSMPYNFISAQAGQVLGELTSTADIFSISLILKLLLVSFVSLVPVIWGDKLKTWIRQFIVTDGDDYERLEKDADDRLELEDINISMRS